MSRGILAQSVAILQEDETTDAKSRTLVDLCVSLRVCDVVPGTGDWIKDTDEELIRVGGRWDKRRKCWSQEDPEKCIIVRVHRGQELAARWLADWFSRRARGVSGTHWDDFERVWSAMFFGGRRGGKSHLACVALVMFAIMVPRSRVWAISPTQDETDELEEAIRGLLPRRWYKFRGGGAGRALQFRLPHGARLFCLSGFKASGLKRGRVDLALYNEGQKMTQAGWIQLRGAIADTGGMVIIAANPPDAEVGRWIEDVLEKARAKKAKIEVFELFAKNNPFIEYQALLDMADEVDDQTYRREILGECVPIGDVVLHAWSDSMSVRDVPLGFVDITAEFTKKFLRRAFDYIVGMDFQKIPHMAAAILKVFLDPTDETKTPLLWVVDEVVADETDEDGLVDALESKEVWTTVGWTDGGYDPEKCAVIADASGDWQDADRTRGRNSFDHLRARKWRHIYKPDANAERNPEIIDRCKATNARLRSAAGNRKMFSCRHNTAVNKSMRSWENRNGIPFRKSKYAHVCDAVTYPVYRFFGRPRTRGVSKNAYASVKRMSRREQMRIV